MKRFFSLILCLTMLVPLAACAAPGNGNTTTPPVSDSPSPETTEPPDTTEPPETTELPETTEPPEKRRILFIGNSFTYYNDLPLNTGIFANVTRNSGCDVIVESVTKGGYYLYQFLDPNDSYGKTVAQKLQKVKYDFVIIQEQSAHPIANSAKFFESCRKFKELIDENGAQMILYATWGYKQSNSTLSKYGKDTAEMEMKLRAAYTAIGEELEVPVAHVGAGFTKVVKEYTALDLYSGDGKHPSTTGSYLAAWTLFGRIFDVDPATCTYNGALSTQVAKVIRGVASDILKNGAPVDEAYRISSSETNPEEKTSTVDPTKTVALTASPQSELLTIIKRNDSTVGNGWRAVYNGTGTFSGIRGDKDKIASPYASTVSLSDAEKADLADIGYGVSVIGISHMDGTKKGADLTSTANGDVTHSVINLVNGHWGVSYMAAIFFDKDTYNIQGQKDPAAPYTGLITLNFGSVRTFDAIGYISGSLLGFPQAQDVYVSDDGLTWTKVESACYDLAQTPAKDITSGKITDPWQNNKASKEVLYSLSGATGKYIRIAIFRGGEISDNTSGLEEINTREIVVFGK